MKFELAVVGHQFVVRQGTELSVFLEWGTTQEEAESIVASAQKLVDTGTEPYNAVLIAEQVAFDDPELITPTPKENVMEMPSLALHRHCSYCAGSGKDPADASKPCPLCGAKGYVKKENAVTSTNPVTDLVTPFNERSDAPMKNLTRKEKIELVEKKLGHLGYVTVEGITEQANGEIATFIVINRNDGRIEYASHCGRFVKANANGSVMDVDLFWGHYSGDRAEVEAIYFERTAR